VVLKKAREKKAGGSLDNPNDVDYYIQTIGRESQNPRLEERDSETGEIVGVKAIMNTKMQ